MFSLMRCAACTCLMVGCIIMRLPEIRTLETLHNSLSETLGVPPVSERPRDCSDYPRGSHSGVFTVYPDLLKPVPVYCEFNSSDSSGWTVIQRRADFLPRLDFYRNWSDYKTGFGNLTEEFYWGNENIHLVTSSEPLRQYELYVYLENFEGDPSRHARYQEFKISPEGDGYRLSLTNYSGDAGDALTYSSGSMFSTYDTDHDDSPSSCAETYHGAWWYNACHSCNLNGVYYGGYHISFADGVDWLPWMGAHYSLKTVVMKIRPTK